MFLSQIRGPGGQSSLRRRAAARVLAALFACTAVWSAAAAGEAAPPALRSRSFPYSLSERVPVVQAAAAAALFERRGEGLELVRQARGAYKNLMASASGADLAILAERVARLDYYAQFLLTDATRELVPLYEDCLATMERAAPGEARGIPENPSYYYWKSACLGLWAKYNGIVPSLRRSGEIMELLNRGRALAPSYEGGGFDRISAAILFLLPRFNPYGPGGDAQLALRLMQRAQRSPPYAGEPDPASATGMYFYESFEGLHELHWAAGRRREAFDALRDALARLDAGAISKGREPETLQWRRKIESLSKQRFPGGTP